MFSGDRGDDLGHAREGSAFFGVCFSCAYGDMSQAASGSTIKLADHSMRIGRSICAAVCEWPPSDPVAGLPDEKNENRDQCNHDKHPVLDLET
jgi:hypothetical protein